MKKRDVLQAFREAMAASQAGPGAKRIGFLSLSESAATQHQIPNSDPQLPEFEIADWQFFSKTGLWDDEPTDGGDADFKTPEGKCVGVAWKASGVSKHQFDFTPKLWPMLYVDVPNSVRTWSELRLQFEPLMEAIRVEYSQHGRSGETDI